MALAQLDDFGRLREYIAQSRSKGIERLPPEPKLSQELHVTRGRLRTLLKKVESEGLIWRHVGKGTFIGRGRPGRSGGKIAQSISVEQFIQTRLALEPQLAAQAAIHATAADLATLDACVTAMPKAETIALWKQLDEDLHLAIARASHNPLLLLLYETMTAEVSLHVNVRISHVYDGGKTAEPRKQTDREHLVLINAIKLHDPKEAENLMRRHILSVRERLFGGL